ncbi:UBX domain-containing protein 6 isoform 2-T2 [Rhinophrynus dorsalis]
MVNFMARCDIRRENAPKPANEAPKSHRYPTSEAQVAAATAALARMESFQGRGRRQSKDTISTQVKKDLAADQDKEEYKAHQQSATATEKKPSLVCDILFRCPLTGDLLRKEEREKHLTDIIQKLSLTDPVHAAILKIHSLNKDGEKVKLAVETMAKYLNNIISHPDEEKYYKIKLSNKVFQERIGGLAGTHEFFEAVGFEKILPVPGQDVQDEFFILTNKAVERLDALQRHCDALLSAEPLILTLERQLRIFTPSSQAAYFDIPDDFYKLTVEEIKLEQKQRIEAVERNSVLRTKAMRKKEEQREIKEYQYTVLRIRLPDGYILQGMFYAWESVSGLFEFVTEQLQNDWLPYELLGPGGHILNDEQATFKECGLVPSSLITFCWDAAVIADVEAAGQQGIECVLKQELLSRVETLH